MAPYDQGGPNGGGAALEAPMGAPVEAVTTPETPAAVMCAWCRRPYVGAPLVVVPVAVLCGGCLAAVIRAAEDALQRLERRRVELSYA